MILLLFLVSIPVVQWVNTQHQLVTVKNVRRCIEIGPSAVLTTMLTRSFQALPANVQAHLVTHGGPFQFLFVNRDTDKEKIFYTEEGSKESPEEANNRQEEQEAKKPVPVVAKPAPV